MGLHKHYYSIPLIQKFYATLAFKKNETHTMMWMTGSTSCEANLHMFAEMLGYPFSGGHHVHRPNSSNKDFLYDLYTQDSSSGWHYYMSSSTLLLASSSLPGQHCFKWREP
jgi:hypothetical protein